MFYDNYMLNLMFEKSGARGNKAQICKQKVDNTKTKHLVKYHTSNYVN